jgi:hypothetical protein
LWKTWADYRKQRSEDRRRRKEVERPGRYEGKKVRRNPQSLAQTGFVKAVLTHSFS